MRSTHFGVLGGALALTACLFGDLSGASGGAPPGADAGEDRDAETDGGADANAAGACTNGRCPPVVVASGQSGITGFAAGGGAVAWTRDGRLYMVQETATPAETPLASDADAATFVGPLAFTGSRFVVTTANDIYAAAPLDVNPGTVDKQLGFLGDPIKAVTGQGNAVAVEWDPGGGPRAAICESDCDGYVGNWLEQIDSLEATPAGGLVLAPSGLYYTQQKTGEVRRCPRASGATCDALASGQITPGPLAVDSDGVTWGNATSGQLLRCPIAGSCPAPSVFADRGAGAAIVTIVAAGDDLYWTESGPGNVAHCPKSGCGAGPELLAEGLQAPTWLAVDGNVLFVVEDGAGRISRLAR